MTLEPLSNDRWGFASRCFVCEPANDQGLRIPFSHDVEAGTVVADFELSEAFSGSPSIAHGGVLMAVCDEAMSWATIALEQAFALTATNSHRFLRPVRLSRPYRVEARITGRDADGIRTSAAITSATTGKVAVEAEALFVPFGEERVADVIGAELGDADRRFLEGSDGGA